MKYLALIYDGFEEEEAMAPFALIRRAKGELTIASNQKTVTGSHNISLTNISLINEINYKEYDCLIVPGGRHYQHIIQDRLALEIIKYFGESNKYLCGICAAPTIFGMLGLLVGKNYTCFTAMNNDFKGNYTDLGVTVDGKIITAKSVAYSIDFAYEIIKQTLGVEALKQVHKQIYYEK